MYYLDSKLNVCAEFPCSVSEMTRQIHGHFPSDKAFWLLSVDEMEKLLNWMIDNKNRLLMVEGEDFYRFRGLPMRVYQ